MKTDSASFFSAAVIVSALGYFVDAFDLLLFGVVRVKSLTELGLSGQALTDASLSLQNWQMAGLFAGGIGAGILGDKLGRVKALYYSIAVYSLGTILNGFVNSVEMYAVCRFLAGVGLAGELGAGITLVAESMPKEKRGLGTTLVASVGMSGALAAGCMGWLVTDWRTAYFIGGGMGLILLVLRLSVSDSEIYNRLRARPDIRRGRILDLVTSRSRFSRLMNSTLLGVTTWYGVGILMLLAPEFGVARGIPEPVSPALAVVWFHLGMVTGDISSGLLSQYLRSRLKAMRVFLALQAVLIAIYLFSPLHTVWQMYVLITLLGFAGGFWAVFITNATEQFGSNLRATAASAVPSMVRLSFVPMALAFQWLKSPEMTGSTVYAAAVVGVVCLALAVWSSFRLEETFERDMDYLEH
ncbi:MAG: MFS transporter [Bacteroidota bacterium]